MKNVTSYCLSLLLMTLFLSHHAQANSRVPLEDYGDPQASNLWKELRELNFHNSSEAIHIIQLGDSHTGGDYFSGRLREQMQETFGDAGIGWVTPGYILNQRLAQTLFKNVGKWTLLDSKQQKAEGTFPLGGLINFSENDALIEVKNKKNAAPVEWNISLWQQSESIPWRLITEDGSVYKFPMGIKYSEDWQVSNLALDDSQISNFKLLAPQKTKLGGIVFDRKVPGVTVDALGNNGSVAAVMSRWDDTTVEHQLRWRNPKLIILAYGTNEAFDSKLVAADYETDLRRNIQRLRAYAPHAAILMLSLPSGAKKTPPNVSVGCPIAIPPNFLTVQQIQQRVAKTEHTLFWNWADFMGGTCGAAQWSTRKPPLMRPDLVHLTAEGYALSAEGLYRALMGAILKN